MKTEEIIEARRSLADAAKRAKEFYGAIPRQPAIRHALDPKILSDKDFDLVLNPPNDFNVNELPNIKYLKSLCHFRKYFENGNGNNWNNFQLNNYNCYLHQGYQPNENVPTEIVHAECWILAAVNNGHCSDLTDGIRFLLAELRPGYGDEEFEAAMDRLQQRPNASPGQIEAARRYPADFKAVLNTLLTGEGEGWLSCFKNHLLRQEILRPQWGIYSNGNHHDLALCIPTELDQVEIRQGNQSMRVRPYQGRLIATVGSMCRAGIDPSQPCVVARDHLPPLDFNSAHIARVRKNTPFSPFLETNENLKIQASALWAAMPLNLNERFRLGEDHPCVDLEQAIPNYGHICKLQFGNIDRTLPKSLTIAGLCLVKIGAAPEINVTNADPWIQSLDEPGTYFVFGNHATIAISDLEVEQNAWSCSGSATFDWMNGQPRIQSNCGHGTKIAVSVDVGRTYPIRIVARFLPEEMRLAMEEEKEWHGDGISWRPTATNLEEFRQVPAQAGLIGGVLAAGQEQVRVWVPSKKPHFWFRHGFTSPTQVDQAAEFGSIEDLCQRHLHIYIPPGIHQICWGAEPWLECEGPGYWEEGMSHIGTEWPLLQEATNLKLRGQNYDSITLAEITSHQTIGLEPGSSAHEIHDDVDIDHFLADEFSIDELASTLRHLRFSGLIWPMLWSWSGRNLKERFDELFEACRSMKSDVTRESVRNLVPCLNHLWEVSKGNRPGCSWIPLSAYRINNTNQPTEFIPLSEIFQDSHGSRIALLDAEALHDNQKSLSARFNYSKNTIFTRINQQKDRPWIFHIWDDGANTPQWLLNESHRELNHDFPNKILDVAKKVFEASIMHSSSLIAVETEQHLAYAFVEISDQFEEINPNRAACFQAAVMCRLHARMEAHREDLDANDSILKLGHPRFTAWLQNFSRDICGNDSACGIFFSDLVTVDWALAWFHEPIQSKKP